MDRSLVLTFVAVLAAFAMGAFFQSRTDDGAAALPTSTPLPTYTPLPSLPTHTPYPSFTPPPTVTPYPTQTPLPTYTALPTNTPYATSTALPTYTPFPSSTPTDTPMPTPTNTAIPRSVIMEGIQELGRLITITQGMADVALEVRYPAAGRVGYLAGACEYVAKHVAFGVIEAGIDIDAIGEENIQHKLGLFDHSYTVTIPAPTISSCRIEQIDQFLRQGGGTPNCFANEWLAMQDIAKHLAMNRFVGEALEDDILERAGEHAEFVLGNLLRELTGSSVDIVFDEAPAEPLIPKSCQPLLPAGWSLDEQGNWRKAH